MYLYTFPQSWLRKCPDIGAAKRELRLTSTIYIKQRVRTVARARSPFAAAAAFLRQMILVRRCSVTFSRRAAL